MPNHIRNKTCMWVHPRSFPNLYCIKWWYLISFWSTLSSKEQHLRCKHLLFLPFITAMGTVALVFQHRIRYPAILRLDMEVRQRYIVRTPVSSFQGNNWFVLDPVWTGLTESKLKHKAGQGKDTQPSLQVDDVDPGYYLKRLIQFYSFSRCF